MQWCRAGLHAHVDVSVDTQWMMVEVALPRLLLLQRRASLVTLVHMAAHRLLLVMSRWEMSE